MTEALFKTAADALRFAFHYSHQQYDRPLMNRLADKRLGGDGRGLSGLDGSGQAGMIRRRLEELSNLERAILIARLAPRTFPCACGRSCCSGHKVNFEWWEAVRIVGSYATEAIAGGEGKYRLRTELVGRYFGSGKTFAAIAEEVGVSARTITRENPLVVHWLRGTRETKTKEGTVGVDAIAMAKAGDVMSEMGILIEEV